MMKKYVSVALIIILAINISTFCWDGTMEKAFSSSTRSDINERYLEKYKEYFPERHNESASDNYEQNIVDEINNNISAVNISDDLSLQYETIEKIDMTDINQDDILLQQSSATLSSDSGMSNFIAEPAGEMISRVYNANETVSLKTGDLIYNYNILSVPVRNGLDLTLSISYNSGNAIIAEEDFSPQILPGTYDYINFAAGWSYNLSTIMKNKTRYGYLCDLSLKLSDGSSYKIVNDEENPNEDIELELKGYSLDDISLVHTANPNEYVLSYSDGRKEYFDGTYGSLIKQEDRFGNYILYEYQNYELISNYVYHVLTKITTDFGMTVNITNDFVTNQNNTQLSKITYTVDDVVYSTINFTTTQISNVVYVDFLQNIQDAEGNVTQFEYIIETNSRQYLSSKMASGHTILLSTVTLPTGGTKEYRYAKHRRAYSHEYSGIVYHEWYDVYKISWIDDFDGPGIEYYYSGDNSGYPHSYPDDDMNISDSQMKYHTIAYEEDLYVIHTFDSNHNKVSEHASYSNKYGEWFGKYKQSVMINNTIYHLDYSDNVINIYSGNLQFQEYNLIASYEDMNYSSIYAVKSSGSTIYIFYKYNNRYSVLAYDTSTEEWIEKDNTTILENDGTELSPASFKYGSGVFYSVSGDDMLMYSPNDTNEWSRISFPHTVNPLCTNGQILYYQTGTQIIEYNLVTKTQVASHNIPALHSSSKYCGFYTNEKLYVYEENVPNVICEANLSNDTLTILESTDMYVPGNELVKGYDGNMYYFGQVEGEPNLGCVYRFEPDSLSLYTLITYRMFDDKIYNILMGPGYAYVMYNSDSYYYDEQYTGMEFVELDTAFYSWTKTNYEYNDKNQMLKRESYCFFNDEVTHIGTEEYSYVPNMNILDSKTDVLGNIITYDYSNSPYYIPTTITKYSDTSNELITNNTLSTDGSKIISTATHYDDRTVYIEYSYSSSYPGNVITKDILDSGDSHFDVVSMEQYVYEDSGRFRSQCKVRDLISNNEDFEIDYQEDIINLYTYDDFGNILSYTDAMNNTVTYTYDKLGRLTRVNYPDNTYVSNTYMMSDGINKIQTSYNGQYFTNNYYDGLGRVARTTHNGLHTDETTIKETGYFCGKLSYVIDAVGNEIFYFYDEYDRVVIVDYYNPDNPYDMSSLTEFATYDDIDRTITRSIGNNSSIMYYDIAGRVIKEEQNTDAGLNHTSYEYDYMGNVVKTIDAKGNFVTNIYNDLGQLISVVDPVDNTTSYEYDSWGNCIKTIYNQSVILTNEYDNISRLLKSTDASGNSEYYAYDKLGRLISYKDKKEQITTNSYDVMGNLLNTQTGTMITGYTYDSFGNPLTMTDSIGTTSYTYTYDGLLQSITTPDSKTISYTYDDAGKVSTVTDYDNNVYSYSYDQTNRVNTITKNDLLVAEYDYCMNGSAEGIEKITYPEGTVEYAYDNAMRVTTQINKLSDGTVISQYDYTYDVIGNKIQKKETVNEIEKVTNYTYDDINRLTFEKSFDGTETSYEFDIQNNISEKVTIYPGNGEAVVTYTYNNLNQLTNITESITDTDDTFTKNIDFTYDSNGNTLTKRTYGQDVEAMVRYTYNPLNQLTEFEDAEGNVTTYAYDGTGMRVSKTQG